MQTNNTFSLIFFTRKSRSNTNRLSIYLRITVNGLRSEISLNRTVYLKQWDATKNRGRGNSSNIRILNAYLDLVYNRILKCHKQLVEEHKIISCKAIKARYLGQNDTQKTLFIIILTWFLF